MKLILIRHGKTEANAQHLYCGSTDLPLSEIGCAELSRRNYPNIDHFRILTSGMQRCEQTLSIMYGKVPHEIDSDFREMNFGAFEMHSYEQMKNDPAYIAWISGDNKANITPNGESGNQMTERVLCALQRLIDDGKDTLLVTHGGVIAAIMAKLFPAEGKNRYEWQPKPGGGYLIDLDATCYSPIES